MRQFSVIGEGPQFGRAKADQLVDKGMVKHHSTHGQLSERPGEQAALEQAQD